MSTSLKPSELVLNPDGSVYHLNLLPSEIGDKIILVGDPSRVSLVSDRFDEIEVVKEKREFITHTGILGDKRISVVSTGIGTDNIDIVMNELDILANVDLEQRAYKEEPKKLRVIRLGTCGILQENIPVGAFLMSKFALGFDSLIHFYNYKESYEEYMLRAEIDDHFKSTGIRLPHYISMGRGEFDFDIPERHRGITVTLPGFYGPQGRDLRAGLKFPDFLPSMNGFVHNELQIVNFEMECSGLYGMSNLLGHDCCTVCIGLANRITGQFIKDSSDRLQQLIQETLEVI